MKKYNVVFCGTPEIGATILKQLIQMEEVNLMLVICQPDKLVGRKKELLPPPVKQIALENNLKVIQPQKIIDDFEVIKQANPDFIITCAYGQFIPEKILNLAKIEPLNLHGSLLPKYRGGAPIQYAIWNGETQTGMSLMRMVKRMDAGPYFVQKKVLIDPSDNSGSLFKKMGQAGALLIQETLSLVGENKLPPIDQDEAQTTFCKNISSEEERINWEQSAFDIHNHIRALAPIPNAFTNINDVRFKIHQARLLTDNDLFPLNRKVHFPGEILYFDKEGIIVQTGSGLIKILVMQKQGKNPSNAGIFAMNSQEIENGVMFGEYLIKLAQKNK
ncbi:methionyl-tRNA formyltransferase [Williamsoniiplasma luminosum]|uniref:Methionyl-tRNA formyltransferase n=1 Tax=Williamsoniiplasma luminosum TaxID=214888 RepID=A0A2S0NJK3_9MOLU|nr:methionyl-tRNA formyltransferase [Williamsoniiplasma luminosum]AVP49182.1 MAG: methionyl-tRNA formyltransferase [Williamsoniiplasma luminosum]